MHQRVVRARQKPVIDERVFLDRERRVKSLEVAGAIRDDTMAQCQILRARGCANRIRLDESQRLHGVGNAGRREEASRNRIAAQTGQG